MRKPLPAYLPQPAVAFALWGERYILSGHAQRLACLVSRHYSPRFTEPFSFAAYTILVRALADVVRCDTATAERLAVQVAPCGELIAHDDPRVLRVLNAEQEFCWLVLRASNRDTSAADFLAAITAAERKVRMPNWACRAWAAITNRAAKLAGRRGTYDRRDRCRGCREHFADPHGPGCRYGDRLDQR
ncbi:hypothetical protein [Micromonospora arborensis]|uniref:hypothetical protein n=1 Tax=Micromonospora arborensis TaxID=2116518 RepID=UPI00371FBCB0